MITVTGITFRLELTGVERTDEPASRAKSESNAELPFMEMRFTASATKGCYPSHPSPTLTLSNASADGRAFSSLLRHCATKSTKSPDHTEELSVGDGSISTLFIV